MDRIRKERDRYASFCTENENFEEQVNKQGLMKRGSYKKEKLWPKIEKRTTVTIIRKCNP